MDETKVSEECLGAPGTIKIGGKTYLASQLTKGDFITLTKHLRAIHKKQTLSPLQALADKIDKLPAHLQERAIKHAVDAEGRNSGGPTQPEAAELASLLYEPDGAAVAAWLSIRKAHPEVTPETLRPHITDANVDELLADLLVATGLEGIGKDAEGKN